MANKFYCAKVCLYSENITLMTELFGQNSIYKCNYIFTVLFIQERKMLTKFSFLLVPVVANVGWIFEPMVVDRSSI